MLSIIYSIMLLIIIYFLSQDIIKSRIYATNQIKWREKRRAWDDLKMEEEEDC